jgi:hypothetical protein
MNDDSAKRALQVNTAIDADKSIHRKAQVSEFDGEVGLKALKYGTEEEKKVTVHFDASDHNDLVSSAVLIKFNFTEKKTEKLLCKSDLPFKLYFEYDSRQLFAYELNGNDAHEAIIFQLIDQAGNFVRSDGNNRLLMSHGIRNYGERMINPDFCLGLKPNVPSNLAPALRDRLVIQVGVSESVASLHGHAAHIFANNTAVQVYMFVKIWKKRKNDTRAICIALYRRGREYPEQLMSIGDAEPTNQFLLFFENQFPDVELPTIQNLNISPTKLNANLFEIRIPGAWILSDANPSLADLIFDCSDMVALIRYL